MFLLQCCYFANHCTYCFVLCSCCHRLHRILPDVREKEDLLKVCLNLDIYTGQNLDLNLAVKMALAMASASVVWISAGPISGFWWNNFCDLQGAWHLYIPFFWQANKVWSSEEECPQHSFLMGKKQKQQQGPAEHTANQNKVKYYPRVTALRIFKS